jgi:hypothetical protein
MIESILSRLLVAVGFICLSLPIDMKKCTIGLITSKPKGTLSERTQSPRGGRLCGEEDNVIFHESGKILSSQEITAKGIKYLGQ